MKKFLTFKKLDPTADFDINFTYRILVNKYKATNVVIGNSKCPTLENHKNFLKNHNYLCYYIIYYKEIATSIFYVDTHNFFGAFVDSHNLRLMVKKYKNDEFFKILNKDLTHSQVAFREFLDIEPNIKHLKSRIHPLNILSRNTTLRIGFQPAGDILTFNRET